MRHAAPPADADCASGRWWRRLQIALHGLAAASLGAWAAGHAGASPALVGLAAVLAAAGAGAGSARRLAPLSGRLRWDGADWWLDAGPGSASGAAEPLRGRAEVLLLGRRRLLVRFVPAGGGAARWLAFDDDAERLRPLRAALLRQPPAAGRPAAPAAAE